MVPIGHLREVILDPARAPTDRPWILAVNGRSASGKTTLADRICRSVPNSAVIHTDDIAWHHSFFGWSNLLIEGILKPVRRGEPVRYRPPGWETHNRAGAIEVDAGLALVVVEGVGASRTELSPWIDRSIWVQSDFAEAERRGIERDGGDEAAVAFWHEWMDEEMPFLEQDRPWERADLIVAGNPVLPHDPTTDLVIASAPGR